MCGLRRAAVRHSGRCDTDLGYYPDKSFDYAILVLTLQTTRRPDRALAELLRCASRL
jgi:hypothetical protein